MSVQPDGSARKFVDENPTSVFKITFTVAGELACGLSAQERRSWEKISRPFPIIPWTREISWVYGETYRNLAARGELIGTNDLWIAATGLAHGLPVVTGNVREFSRVKGLEVIPF